MLYRGSIGAIALTATLCATIAGAQAWDESKYPDLTGQWVRAMAAVALADTTRPNRPREDKKPADGGISGHL